MSLGNLKNLIKEMPQEYAEQSKRYSSLNDIENVEQFWELRYGNWSDQLAPKSESYLQKLKSQVLNGNIDFSGPNAKEVLEMAILSPKGSKDVHGHWFKDSVYQLVNLLCKKVYRSQSEPVNYRYEFINNSYNWIEIVQRAILKYGNVYEVGVLIEAQNGKFHCISIPIPLIATNKYWINELTPEEIFFGREDIIGIFKENLAAIDPSNTSGKTYTELAIQRAFNSSDIVVWWGEIIKNNLIIDEYRDGNATLYTRHDFSYRMTNLINEQLNGRETHLALTNPRSVRGYFIQAFEEDGQISKRLILDSKDWTEMRDPINKPSYFRNGEWSFSGDNFLYTSIEEEKLPKISIQIKLAEIFNNLNEEESTAIEGFKIVRYIRHPGSLSKPKVYYFNFDIYGTGWLWDNDIAPVADLIKKKSQPLQLKQWMEIKEAFQKAINQMDLNIYEEDRANRLRIIFHNMQELIDININQLES